MAPPLFPALKEWVRKHPQPGQFILTGSVRFTSRKAIRESLTGRIVSLELYPLVISELLERDLPDIVPELIRARQFDQNTLLGLMAPTRQQSDAWTKYLERGGLPRIAFTRDERNRNDLLDSLLRTILDRDLRMVLETRLSLETLLKFLRFIATNAWQIFHYSDARRETGLTEVTQKKLLFALESIFLVRRIPVSGRSGAIFFAQRPAGGAVFVARAAAGRAPGARGVVSKYPRSVRIPSGSLVRTSVVSVTERCQGSARDTRRCG